ncbi:hypothetical protein Tco_0070572 [Tanacetum coccineum]
MVNGVEDPKTRTIGGVRLTEDMDCAINDLASKFASMSTVLEEIRSATGGGGNHANREGNNHGDRRFRPNNDGFFHDHAEIPNFLGNLDLEAVLDWLYEVDKFFDIMDVPEEEQVNIVAYKPELGGKKSKITVGDKANI